MLKWGRKGFGVVFPQKLGSLSHTEGGGGGRKIYPVLRGSAKGFEPAILPFYSPPLPVINDQSLIFFRNTSEMFFFDQPKWTLYLI